MDYGYEEGDHVIGLCWLGGGEPQVEAFGRYWEVRTLKAAMIGGRMIWKEANEAVCSFWGDFSQLEVARNRARAVSDRMGIPFVAGVLAGREVQSKEEAVIEMLKSL